MNDIVRPLAGVLVVGFLAIALLCGCQGHLKVRIALDVDAVWEVEQIEEGVGE